MSHKLHLSAHLSNSFLWNCFNPNRKNFVFALLQIFIENTNQVLIFPPWTRCDVMLTFLYLRPWVVLERKQTEDDDSAGQKGQKGFCLQTRLGSQTSVFKTAHILWIIQSCFLVWQTEHISMLQNAGPDISASDRETEVMNIVLVLPMVIVSLGIRVGWIHR